MTSTLPMDNPHTPPRAQQPAEPTRAEIDNLETPVMLEFGARWCGYCQAAQPLIAAALEQHRNVRHVRVEDGPGRPLGRSFKVKLWPTLIFISDGSEVARLVRPARTADIQEALRRIDTSPVRS
jgi:thioredoxin 1